jgi:hypothetical protein
MKMVLDGTSAGRYSGRCECGFVWAGVAQRYEDGFYSPALPIAEASTHLQLSHGGQLLELRFTEHYQHWLEQTWTRANAAGELAHARMER